jgi:hypothetical protein
MRSLMFCTAHPNILRVIKWRRMRWAGNVARVAERRGVNSASFGKPEGKRLLGSPRRRWEYNIKTDLVEFEFLNMEWIKLAQDRHTWWALVNELIKVWVP